MTTLKVLGWSSRGLRCPDYLVSFEKENGNVYPVSLIQMPNGTGKTTTLTLLRATLSGIAKFWGTQEVRSFQKKKNPQDHGEFNVSLMSDGRRVTISLIFDFDEGRVSYTTTSENGKKLDFYPPKECRDFFNKDFINFFVFDGELAPKLLDSKFADAEKAIKYLFKLRYIEDITNLVNNYWKQVVENVKASEFKGLKRRQNRVNTLSKRIIELENEQNKFREELHNVEKKLSELNERYKDKILEKEYHGNDYKLKLDLYNAAAKRVEDMTNQLMKEIKSPHMLSTVFGQEVLDLKRSLDKVKLPESTAKEFFDELANEDVCVCGRPLDEKHKEIIRQRAKNYLGSEEMNFLNLLKAEISEQIGADPSKYGILFNESLQSYDDLIQERLRTKTELQAVEDYLSNGDTELLKEKEQISDFQNLFLTLKKHLSKFDDCDDSQGDERTFGISILKVRLEGAKSKLAEITDTLEIKIKTEIAENLLKYAQDMALKEITSKIKFETNERLKDLLPNNDIKISKINKSLHLEGQEGGSVGENLSVAYAFMSTLFGNTERQLPFIVDSPANAIDLKVREEVAQLIPKLSSQFIAFTISSEREGFITPLDKVSREPIQYITLFKKGDSILEMQTRKYEKVTTSEDGIQVVGKEFFLNFHKENEVED